MKQFLTVFIITILFCSAESEWILVDDFQQWTTDQVFKNAHEFGWESSTTEHPVEYKILADPIDSANRALTIFPDPSIPEDYPVITMVRLPGDGIQPDSVGTIYFRFYLQKTREKQSFGTGSRDFDNVDDWFNGDFDDFNALYTIQPSGSNDEEDIFLKQWNGDSYGDPEREYKFEVNGWYSVFIIIHNYYSSSDSTGYSWIYITEPGRDSAHAPFLKPKGGIINAKFRDCPMVKDGAGTPIEWFLLSTVMTTNTELIEIDKFHIDDIYYSEHLNINSPLVSADYPCYGLWPVQFGGDVYTENFLGWISIRSSPYIFSYSINNWIYMEEPAQDSSGAWGYFYK